jgi:hypothetical protein
MMGSIFMRYLILLTLLLVSPNVHAATIIDDMEGSGFVYDTIPSKSDTDVMLDAYFHNRYGASETATHVYRQDAWKFGDRVVGTFTIDAATSLAENVIRAHNPNYDAATEKAKIDSANEQIHFFNDNHVVEYGYDGEDPTILLMLSYLSHNVFVIHLDKL